MKFFLNILICVVNIIIFVNRCVSNSREYRVYDYKQNDCDFDFVSVTSVLDDLNLPRCRSSQDTNNNNNNFGNQLIEFCEKDDLI